MKWIVALMAIGAATAIPKENLTPGTPPSDSSAVEGAARLLAALQSNDKAQAADFFFPKAAFDLVKDMPVPERYWKKLYRWYGEDIATEHGRFKSGEWTVESIALGRCKWKAPGTEGNKVAYWSCRGNFVTARSGDRKRRFEIRVLINWGDKWYVTHLGPIR